jgi:ribosomal protein L16/L10AE
MIEPFSNQGQKYRYQRKGESRQGKPLSSRGCEPCPTRSFCQVCREAKLTQQQLAEALCCSVRTVQRDGAARRQKLRQEVPPEPRKLRAAGVQVTGGDAAGDRVSRWRADLEWGHR